ncbi:MAG: nitrogenase component 1 [Georgfuchsia sp.]
MHDVNLIGEYNIAGEFWHLAPLFDELGLRILCTLSGDARYSEVQTMHRAEASMVVCAKALLSVARKLEGRRALLYTGGVKSWSVVSALQDLRMEVVATGTRKSTEEDKQRIREIMGDDAQMITDGSPAALLKAYKDDRADIFIAGGRNLYTALKARIPFLDINQEREFGYAGYAGMPELGRQLALTISWHIAAHNSKKLNGGNLFVTITTHNQARPLHVTLHSPAFLPSWYAPTAPVRALSATPAHCCRSEFSKPANQRRVEAAARLFVQRSLLRSVKPLWKMVFVPLISRPWC